MRSYSTETELVCTLQNAIHIKGTVSLMAHLSFVIHLNPGFHMIATIAVATIASDRCDHMETTLATVAIVAIIWKPCFSVTILSNLVPFWFIITSLVFSYLRKLLV